MRRRGVAAAGRIAINVWDVACRLPGGLLVDIKAGRLPIGAGLGSSAAVSVATAAALLEAEAACGSAGGCGAAGAPPPPPRWDAASPASAGGAVGLPPLRHTLESVNAWAFAGEKLFHGAPSGLDNTVSAFGGALAYCREPRRQERIEGMPALRVLVCNTRVPKDTRALVAGACMHACVRACERARTHTPPLGGAGVAELRRRMPLIVDPILGAIGALSTRAEVLLARGQGAAGTPPDTALVEALSELVTINQSLLRALGVGHAALDSVCRITGVHGLASKLTGAGGGGCAMTLLGAATPVAAVGAVVRELEAEGFECFETNAGGPGVLLHVGADAGVARNLT